jgi:hypothetical protein
MTLPTLAALKRGLLVFWMLWLSVVVATNVLNGLQALSALPESFKFVSGNWQWINQTMDPLGVPHALQTLLFAGVVVWEGLAAVLFWRAFATYRGRSLVQEPTVIAACAVNLALWAAFQVLDEVFLAYQPQGVHRAIFANQIITVLALYLLPEEGMPSSVGGEEQNGEHYL